MSDVPVVTNNTSFVTIASAIVGANADDHCTLHYETGAHTDYVPLGAADCTADDVNYTCLVRDTDSKLENVNTAHQTTGGENTDKRSNSYPEPTSYDNSHTQSATHNNNARSHNNATEPSYDNSVHNEPSYDNNVGPASNVHVQQQETRSNSFNNELGEYEEMNNEEVGVYEDMDSDELGVYEVVDNEELGVYEDVDNGEFSINVSNLSDSLHSTIDRDNYGIYEPVTHYDHPAHNNSSTNNPCVTHCRSVWLAAGVGLTLIAVGIIVGLVIVDLAPTNDAHNNKLSTTSKVKSATHWKDIVLNEFADQRVTALSVSFDGQLLLAVKTNIQNQVYVYDTTNGSHVTTLHLPGGYLIDVAWTLRGNIVFTSAAYVPYVSVPAVSEVVIMSLNGSEIASTVSKFDDPFPLTFQSLSVSTDGAIYMTVAVVNDSEQSEIPTQHYVYESTDEGVTWTVVFEMHEDYQYWTATKVSTDPQHSVFWTGASDYSSSKLANYSVRVYAVTNKPRNANVDNTKVTWHDINETNIIQNENALIKLIYDGQSNVFTSNCRDVYTWSVNDESELILIESSVDNTPHNSTGSISVDRQRSVLYAGKRNGSVISVYNLTYM